MEGLAQRLRVADDGRGFAEAEVAGRDGRDRPLGILGMRERLRPWGGVVRVARGDGGGTVVSAEVPLGDGDGVA